MAGNDLALRELNLLTKTKLIEIILSKKVPSDTKVSESTRKLIEFEFMDTNSENGETNQNHPDLACKLLCIEGKLKCANYEIDCLKRLITEMERSISNQQITISSQENLLKIIKESASDEIKKSDVANPSIKSHSSKEKGGKLNNTSEKRPQRVLQSTDTSGSNDTVQVESDIQSDIDSKKGKRIPSNNKPSYGDRNELNSILVENNEWKTVTRINNSRKGTICTGLGAPKQEKPTIIGAQRKKWIYLGRIAGDTSEDAISAYLSHINGHEDIVVKKLNTLGSNSAFSIGASTGEIYELLNNKDFWPTGALLRPFNFQNFSQRGGKNLKKKKLGIL